MAFKRTVEDFVCGHCGADNSGDGYTNHCSACLYSRHVDVDPGDRAADCGGLMAPVDLLVERGRQVVVHRCEVCGEQRRCRAAPADDNEAMLEVIRRRATRF